MIKNGLEGIRILDLSRLLPGPYCSMLLADMGAEVIKIEDPVLGDYFRDWEPKKDGNSVYFIGVNRNKKSITLDLKNEKQREKFYKLVTKCDVVIESFRPGVTSKLGIDFDTLKKFNEQLIYCSITGYGQNTSLKNRAGHDMNYLALSGVLGLCGTREKVPPMLGIQIADMCGAIFGVIGILQALLRREKIKEAQYIDVAMMDGLYSFLSMFAYKYFYDKIIPEAGSTLFNGGFACYNIFETKDNRYFTVAAIEDKFWNRFCEVLGKEDWKGKNVDKKAQDEIIEELTNIFKSKTFSEWIDIFSKEDICVEPILNFKEAFDSDFVKERGLLFEIDNFTHIKSPNIFNPQLKILKTPPPEKGEHTEEVFKSFGIDIED